VSRTAAATLRGGSSGFTAPLAKQLAGVNGVRWMANAHEKVKVLLVLYDGGQHAIDVSLPISSNGFSATFCTVNCLLRNSSDRPQGKAWSGTTIIHDGIARQAQPSPVITNAG
jgi:hypothetical protein